MAIKFINPTLHGAERFVPGVSLAFADAAAEPYFLAAGFAEPSDDTPLMTYPEGTIEVDPDTIFADGPKRGQRVLEA